MLSSILLNFKYVRDLAANLEAAQKHVEILLRDSKEAGSMVEALLEKAEGLESSLAQANHSLDIERSRKIAAETIAVSRETELEWLREQYNRALESRDAAMTEQYQSLNLVNTTLLKQTEAEAPPTKEQMAGWKPVPKGKQQPVPLMRQAERNMIQGLQRKARGFRHPEPPTEKVQ